MVPTRSSSGFTFMTLTAHTIHPTPSATATPVGLTTAQSRSQPSSARPQSRGRAERWRRRTRSALISIQNRKFRTRHAHLAFAEDFSLNARKIGVGIELGTYGYKLGDNTFP